MFKIQQSVDAEQKRGIKYIYCEKKYVYTFENYIQMS